MPELQHEALKSHIDRRIDEITVLIKAGFPQGDPHAHRMVHENLFQQASDRADLWRAVREKSITGVVWAALGIVGLAVLEWVKMEVKR